MLVRSSHPAQSGSRDSVAEVLTNLGIVHDAHFTASCICVSCPKRIRASESIAVKKPTWVTSGTLPGNARQVCDSPVVRIVACRRFRRRA